jgi:hypothetical protein
LWDDDGSPTTFAYAELIKKFIDHPQMEVGRYNASHGAPLGRPQTQDR